MKGTVLRSAPEIVATALLGLRMFPNYCPTHFQKLHKTLNYSMITHLV